MSSLAEKLKYQVFKVYQMLANQENIERSF